MEDQKGVPGWCDFHELYLRMARNARDGDHFVEVGCWLGRSAVHMGHFIRELKKQVRFDTVDSFVGVSREVMDNDVCRNYIDFTPDQLEAEYLDNIARFGLSDIIHHKRMLSVDAAKTYDDNSLAFVFIDAAHDRESVKADIEAWWPKVRPGGYLSGHDYDQCGIEQVVTKFAFDRGLSVEIEGRCYTMRKSADTRTFLALPSYGLLDSGMAMAAIAAPTANKQRVGIVPEESSLLSKCFNNLWVQALNDRQYTHFAMLHADIVPQAHWLDILHDEMERTGADIVGVVAPIKDHRGVTSIGIGQDYPWSPKKRFTIKEIMSFPETFTAADAGYPGEPLLLNTGCWLADLRNPKWREVDENGELKIYFTINDRIKVEPDGKYIACVQSEDWFFSRRLHDAGLKAVCTRKVSLRHIGKMPFPNDVEWGEYESGDEDTARFWRKEECQVGQ